MQRSLGSLLTGQGSEEGPWLPTTSRVRDPRPHCDDFHCRFAESSFSERAPQLFTNNSQWQNMAQSARARQLWLLLRTGLQTFVEKVRLGHGISVKASFLTWLLP